eukprot:g5333.t1
MSDPYTLRYEERALDLAHLERLVASASRFAETHRRAQWNLLSDANHNVISLCTGEHDLLPAIARQARARQLPPRARKAHGIDLPNNRAQFFIGPMAKPVEVIKSKRKSRALQLAEARGCCRSQLPPRVCLLQYTYTTPRAIMVGKHFLPETDLTRCLWEFDKEVGKKSRGKKRSHEIHLMFNFVTAKLYTVQQVAEKGDRWFKTGQASKDVVGFTNKKLWKFIKKTATIQLKQREALFQEQLEAGQLAMAEAADRKASEDVERRNGTDITYEVDTDEKDLSLMSDPDNATSDENSSSHDGSKKMSIEDEQDADSAGQEMKMAADLSATNNLMEDYQTTSASQDEGKLFSEEEKQASIKGEENNSSPEAAIGKPQEEESAEHSSLAIPDGDLTTDSLNQSEQIGENHATAEDATESQPHSLNEEALRESIVPEGMTTVAEAQALFEPLDLFSEREPKHTVYVCRDDEEDAKPRQKGKLVSVYSARGRVLFVRKLLHDMPHLSLLQAEQFCDNILEANRQEVEFETETRSENEIYRITLPYVVFGSYCIDDTWYLVMDLRPHAPHYGAACRACKICCTSFCARKCCYGCGCQCCMHMKTFDNERSGLVSNFHPLSTWNLFLDLVYEAEAIKFKFLRIFEIRRMRHGFRLPFKHWQKRVGLLPCSTVGAPEHNAELEPSTDADSPNIETDGSIDNQINFTEAETSRDTAAQVSENSPHLESKKSQNTAINISEYLSDLGSDAAVPYMPSAEELEEHSAAAKAKAKQEKLEQRKFKKARRELIKRFPSENFHYMFRMEMALRGISRMHAEHLRATVHGQLSIGGASENDDPIEIAAQVSSKIAEDKEIADLGKPKNISGVDDIYELQTLQGGQEIRDQDSNRDSGEKFMRI